MPCNIKNPANIDLGPIEPHVNDMYDHFAQKYGFKKPPTMVFDSDPNNQPNVLGKTAYYDPSTLEIHIYTDGRHPKDMLRSIAHELIHHRQNLEGRLNVGGYHGEGYYLKNEELKKLEHEAMLDGNATMREWEDKIKKENNQMSLKEWKNNELNTLLLKKFGILKENKKPDEDGDGVPDWADKKPGEDDNASESKEEEDVSEAIERLNKLDKADDSQEEPPENSEEPEEEKESEEILENKGDLNEVVQKVLKNNKKLRLRFK